MINGDHYHKWIIWYDPILQTDLICENNKNRHLLVFVINELGVLAESYGCVNIKNATLQYSTV